MRIAKDWYKSKAFWFAILTIVVGIASSFGFGEWVPDAGLKALLDAVILVVVGITNLVLRLVRQPQPAAYATKPWYASKTVWFAVLTVLVGVAAAFGFGEWVPDAELQQLLGAIVTIVVAAVNIILNLVTTKKIG